jgi:threonine/homoserine/homoserine lactone efflux protein
MSPAFPLLSAAAAFIAAIPLGPVNMEIIRRVLNRHPGSALIFASGACIADGLWPLAVFFGLVPLLKTQWVATVFWIIAVFVLLFLGISFIREAREKYRNPSLLPAIKKKRVAILTGFFLVLSNPSNLITWSAIIGIFQNEAILPACSIFSGFVLWISVAAGTLIYFCIIILLVNRHSQLFIKPKRLVFLQTFFGIIILTVALYFGYNLIRTLTAS